ncbi:hypothetical protein [uncultured Sneathiella sp.]|uniref:hypothetical protein n=1 Tax=uncultured Sneathiella sp. TaxID=879315 RepID=UPI002595AF18|nr:hypothetical protein [uncultured Sneathiella sp.]
MRKPNKPSARTELERIENALIESILQTSEEELRDELSAAGIDPDSEIANVRHVIEQATEESTSKRLGELRMELEAWRGRNLNVSRESLASAQKNLDLIRSGDKELDNKITLAARKGEGLSDSDLEGLLEDLVALEELDRTEDDE